LQIHTFTLPSGSAVRIVEMIPPWRGRGGWGYERMWRRTFSRLGQWQRMLP